MSIQKSNMTIDGQTVHMSMSFSKVDKANRLVSGYATLDNIDTQGDIVLAEASAKAFARARGNIREMHQPLAVGKMVDFREDEFYDPETKSFYRGIFVTARVSEGAEDTWAKVLDGTLAGFSIGGEIKDSSNEFVKEAGRTVRFIKDYDLVELSLVDNPANQLASIHSFQKNIFSIDKNGDGNAVFKGMVAETVVENVFICPEDSTVIVKDSDSEECPSCSIKMENAGWFELGPDRAEKVSLIVSKYHNVDVEVTPTEEGGVEMTKNNNEVTKSEDPVPEGKPVEVVNPSEEFPDGEKIEEEAKSVDETEVEEAEAESPEEVPDVETEISKKIDDLHTAVSKSLAESREETLAKVSELEKKIDETTAKFSDLETRVVGFGEKLETSKSRLAELEARLEKFNSSEAFRKSADVQSAEKIVQKEKFWGNAFSDS